MSGISFDPNKIISGNNGKNSSGINFDPNKIISGGDPNPEYVAADKKVQQKAITTSDSLKNLREDFSAKYLTSPTTQSAAKNLTEIPSYVKSKTTIPSADYDAGYAKQVQLAKEMSEAKRQYETAKANDERTITMKVLDGIGGVSNSVSDAKAKYQAKKKEYETQLSENTERNIQIKYGMTGAEYVEQLKQRKKNAVNDDEKFAISAELKSVRKNLYGESNVFKYIGDSIKEGVTSAAKLLTSTGDFFLGNAAKVLGFENNYFTRLNEEFTKKRSDAQVETLKSAKALGHDSNIIGEVVSGATAAVPDVIITTLMAYLSGGTSLAAKGTQLGSEAIAKANPTFLYNLQKGIQETAKSPIYYTSFIREVGISYEEAMASGEASEAQAALAALAAATVNARIEMGGIQELPEELIDTKGVWKKFLNFLTSAPEEGLEEVEQGIISDLTNKVFYDSNKKLYSNTDADAVINPINMAQEFAMGTAVGLLLGGGQLTFNGIIQAKSDSQYKEIGKAVSKTANVQEIIDYSKSATNDDIKILARAVNAKNITDADIGRLYQYAIKDITEKFDDVYTEADFEVVINEYFSSDVSQSIKNIASATFANKLMEMNVEPEQNEIYKTFTETPQNSEFQSNTETMVDSESGITADTETNGINATMGAENNSQNPDLQSTAEAGSGIIKGKPNRGPLNKAEQDYILKVAKFLGREVKFVHMYDELKAMGEDVSNGIPDGAFDNNTGVIYIDFAAKDPILFVFKHELTHFTENTEQYDKFVKAVKKSKAFHEWLCNRTKLESNDVEALIEKYQMIISEVQPKGTNLDAEMYADFVGDILFRDDGSKLESLLSGLDYKERNAVVQYILDFLSYLKKKLAGNKELVFEISRLEDNFNRALSEATATKKFPTNGGGVQYDINAVNITEADIKQNIADIVKMKSVSEMSGNEFSKGAKDLVTQVDDYFATFGYSVENSVLGDVDITARGAKDSIAHGIGRNKAVAFAAVPKVIESGKIIDYQTNWKNRGYDTVVLAAPVTINNAPYYEGVIVIRDSKTQRFYVHEVITEKRTDMSFKTGADNKIGKSGDTSSPSILSLLDKIRVVKENLTTEQADNNRDTAETAGGVDNNSGLSPTDNVSTDSIPDNQETVNNNSMHESGNNSKNNLQFSFARVYDMSLIKQAEQMEERLKAENKSENEIRKEIWKKIGLIRDTGDVWVYEIDDSKIEFSPYGDALNELSPKVKEFYKLADLGRKTPEKRERYNQLREKYGSPFFRKGKLKDFLKHDALFEKYPQLKETNVEFKMISGPAQYNPETDTIEINAERLLKKNGLKGLDKQIEELVREIEFEDTMVHEIQHAIQHDDKRENGSNVEFWKARLLRGERLPINTETGEEFTPYDAYMATKGEYEARESKNRKNLNEQERREKVPDLGWGKTISARETANAKNLKFSIPTDTEYMLAVESGDMDTAQWLTDSAAKAAGYTERLYHQTGADFTEFNTNNQKAGKYDWELPTGTFLKPTDNDIGLKGKKQMELYAKFQNPLTFENRKEARKFWSDNVDGYSEAAKEIQKLNAEYRTKVDEAEADTREYLKKWRRNNPDKDSREIYKDTEYQRLNDIEDGIVDEWEEKDDELSLRAKELINGFISKNDYDGIIVEKDVGSHGRYTKTYIAFESAQMKSAEAVTYDDNGDVIPLGERFNAEQRDIRYSVPNEMRTLFNRYNSGEITAEQYEAGVDEFWNKTIAKMEDKALAQSIENMRELAKIKEKNKKNSQKLSYRNRQIKRKNEQLKKQRAELKLYNEKVTPYGTVSFGKNLEMTKSVLSRIKTRQQMNSDKKHIPELLKPYANQLLIAFSREYPMPFNKESIENLKGEYLKLSAQIGFDPEIAEILDELSEGIDGKTIKELGFGELLRIRQVTENFWHMIQEKEEVFLEGKRQEIKEIGNRALSELSQKKVKRGNSITKAYEIMMYNNTLPIYYFERLGGVFKGLFDTLMDGEDTNQRHLENGKTYVNQTQDKYNYSKWKDDDIKPIITERGKKVHLSVEQTMLLYATYKREKSRQTDQTEHILEGGITVPNRGIIKDIKERFKDSDKKGAKRLYETFTEELYTGAISVTENDVAALVNQLTIEQKAYADTIVKYLSEDMAALGNQTSMEFFGYCKYNDTYYIPFCSDKNYLNMQISTMDGNHSSLKHSSFTHNLSKGAKTPLVMGNFSEVCADHIQKMCRYNASAATLDAMLKVLNYQSDSGKSVSAEIKSVYGEHALNYLIDFLRKMNGTIDKGSSDEFIDKLIGLYRKNAVSASLSVAVQQPTSLPRAWLEINPKYFVRKSPKSDYEEMLKYCPVGGMKERGRVDIGTGAATVNWILSQSPDTIAEKTKALVDVKDSSYRDDKFMGLAAKGDEWTWKHIWTAVKRETTAKTKLKVGTDEFYEACNKRFRYIINKTQVYDSPISKSKIMSGGLFSKMFTAFAAEPTVWANALMNMNKRTAAKTISIFILAGALNAALKSFVTAPRDDDEDKTYWEKYSEDFWEGFQDNINPAANIPILRDVISIKKGYDVERPDMSAITDLVDAYQALSSDKKSTYRKIEDFAGALAAFTGLPVKNIMRDVRAAYNFYTDMFVDDDENREINREVAGYMDELYDNDTFKAFEDEDKEKLEEKITDTVKNVQKAQENKTALQDFDELYELLRKNKSDYNKVRQKMIDEGRYTADEITNGVEIARVAYMKSLGIDVGEYLLYKIATSEKYADTNKSGGVNTDEKEAAIDNLDLDSDTKDYFKKKHK